VRINQFKAVIEAGDARRLIDQIHELFGQHHAVMQIGGLTVHIAAGRFAHIKKLFDLRMIDRKVSRVRAAPCDALTERQHLGVHNLKEGDHTG